MAICDDHLAKTPCVPITSSGFMEHDIPFFIYTFVLLFSFNTGIDLFYQNEARNEDAYTVEN